ncbi:putative activator 1 41 kda subunit [Erysiphe neolycopersici]|uniref:Putative activator 1 41 kDa subunit n=1 Tax=Erysiphe neolycopersici TaxID=212602 RepID=A0A420H7M8_9PEZI|nr:putative activator 1 41 kda subunit [Erysiphe neolycopersici]
MVSFFDLKARKEAATASSNNTHFERKQSISTLGREVIGVKYLSASRLNAFYSRPKTLSDVTAQEHTITVLQRNLQSSNACTFPSLSQR